MFRPTRAMREQMERDKAMFMEINQWPQTFHQKQQNGGHSSILQVRKSDVAVADEKNRMIKHSGVVEEEEDDCSIIEPDECVILDSDPFGSIKEITTESNGEDTEEDVSVVAERGQVACRDYPHSRHLCVKFPFDKTPHLKHCEQCYCYVCDSIAPCKFWSGVPQEHCHATEDNPKWKALRGTGRPISSNNETFTGRTTPSVQVQTPLELVQFTQPAQSLGTRISATVAMAASPGRAHLALLCRLREITLNSKIRVDFPGDVDNASDYSPSSSDGNNCGSDRITWRSDKCFNCGSFGHWARECPRNSRRYITSGSHNNDDSGNINDSGYSSGGDRLTWRSGKCFNCGLSGHWARECPTNSSTYINSGSCSNNEIENISYAGDSGGGDRLTRRSDKCFNCGFFGHWAPDCPY